MGEDINIRGLRMKAIEIDSDGVWSNDEYEIPLLGSQLPIPENVQVGDNTYEEVLAIADAADYIDECPKCGEDVTGVIIVMVTVRMFPAHCCNTIMWYNEDDYDDETE